MTANLADSVGADDASGVHLARLSKIHGPRFRLLTLVLAVCCLFVSWYFATEFAKPATFHLRYGLINDLYIPWNAGIAILHRMDPYSDEVTEQNQHAAFGATARSLNEGDARRFSYPVYAAFPYVPLGLTTFETANRLAFWLLALLAGLSVGWARGGWDRETAFYSVLFFASYPLILALQVRQPTILFLALGVAGFHLFRSGNMVGAGILAALSTGKPQVALPIVLPMMIWTSARWRERKAFFFSLAAASAALVVASSLLVPRWIAEWTEALRSYTHYCGPSLVNHYLGDRMGFMATAFIAVFLTAVLWVYRECDLLFLTSVSVVVCQFILPVFMYSEVILLIPAIWVANNASLIKSQGNLSQLTLALVRVALFAFWAATAVGAVALHMDQRGKDIAWEIGQRGIMIAPLLWSLLAMAVVQLVVRTPGLGMASRAAVKRNEVGIR